METDIKPPIFIHSLFRSGSTYVFDVFRRAEAGYWCYQEPLNEKLLFNANHPEIFLEGVQGAKDYLRHPQLDKPHCFEFYPIAQQLSENFDSAFSYKEYFLNDNPSLLQYFQFLLGSSQERAVFQCCRTAGRVEQLKSNMPSIHVFLWRNPWDQWLSYKRDGYFESRNLFILYAKKLPAFLHALKADLPVADLGAANDEVRSGYCNNRQLSAQASYSLFYAIWCHAMLEALPHCDANINIDELSAGKEHQTTKSIELQRLGISGLDFSQCDIPTAKFGEADGEFFLAIEDKVHHLLIQNGYKEKQLEMLYTLQQKRANNLVDTKQSENADVRDAMRAREYMRTSETKLSDIQRQLFQTRALLQKTQAK